MPPRGSGEAPEVSRPYCIRLDLYPDHLPPPQPATNAERPRASANDCQTAYARTAPLWKLVSCRPAYNPGNPPVLTHVTVCTFAGLLTILGVPLSQVFTHDCLQALATSVVHPRVTSMPSNNACNTLKHFSALSCRRVILVHSDSLPSFDKTNSRGQS